MNWIETYVALGASLLVSIEVTEYRGKVVGERLGSPGLQVGIMVRQLILAGIAVFLPTGAQAQGRGTMPPVFHAAAGAPRVVTPAPHVGTAQPIRAPHVGTAPATPGTRPVPRGGAARPRTTMPVPRSTRSQDTGRRRFEDEDNGIRPGCSSAPGLGFDAVHQAATCGSGSVGLRSGGLGVPFFFPFFDGGFSLPGSQAAVDENSAAESAQQEATDAEIRELRRRNRALQAALEPTPTPAPVQETASSEAKESEPFVFVRRDGTVFFAVAYAWEKGTLRYVTGQGLRRTVTQDALDLDATRQFNEQRGLNFRSPA